MTGRYCMPVGSRIITCPSEIEGKKMLLLLCSALPVNQGLSSRAPRDIALQRSSLAGSGNVGLYSCDSQYGRDILADARKLIFLCFFISLTSSRLPG